MEPSAFWPEMTKKEKKLCQQIQEEIAYCINCQPWDEGEAVWIHGEQIYIDDLFDEFEVPEKSRGTIGLYLHCPYCGHSSFEPGDSVAREDRYVLEVLEHIKCARSRFGSDISRLRNFLEGTPYLATLDPLAQAMWSEIAARKFPSVDIAGEWYRARIVTGGDVYGLEQMDKPPKGRSPDGRYHHAGQSFLYLANGKNEAVREVIDDPSKGAIVWMQKYQIKSFDGVLDLNTDFEGLGPTQSTLYVALVDDPHLKEEVKDRKSTWKPEYFLTRLISDMARRAGYTGIRYRSSRGPGENLVIFQKNENVVPEDEPMVFHYKGSNDKPFGSPDDDNYPF